MSIEGGPTVTAGDTIPLNIWQFRQNSYYLQLTGSNFSPDVTAYVKDSYLHKEIPVDLSSVTLLPFSIDTTVPNSFVRDRFTIVFKGGSTLPVTLTDIKAYQIDKGIQVDWTAHAEINIDHYEVEKSVDGRQFEKVNVVIAENNSAVAPSYGWFDTNVSTGSNFYRIKVIEKSGAVKYSAVVKVNIAEGNRNITIFPNPVKGNVIQVHLSNVEKGRYAVVLYNNLGQNLYSGTIEHTTGSGTYKILSGRLISKGPYTLQITKGDTCITERVIVE
ncbi:MAG: T9SS type A sorting domain-containing protein [Segetibacter sp.]